MQKLRLLPTLRPFKSLHTAQILKYHHQRYRLIGLNNNPVFPSCHFDSRNNVHGMQLPSRNFSVTKGQSDTEKKEFAKNVSQLPFDSKSIIYQGSTEDFFIERYKKNEYINAGVIILVIIETKGLVVFVKRYRSIIEDGEVLLELPSKRIASRKIESEQTTPRNIAQQIILNAGYHSEKITPFCEFYSSPDISNERILVYKTEDAVQIDWKSSSASTDTHYQQIDELDKQEVKLLSISGMQSLYHSNSIADAKTCAAIGIYITGNWNLSVTQQFNKKKSFQTLLGMMIGSLITALIIFSMLNYRSLNDLQQQQELDIVQTAIEKAERAISLGENTTEKFQNNDRRNNNNNVKDDDDDDDDDNE